MATNYLLAGMIFQGGGGGVGGHHIGGGWGVFLLSVQHGGEYISTMFGCV